MLLSLIFALLPAALAAPVNETEGKDIIQGQYIVKFKADSGTYADLGIKIKSKPNFEYTMKGFHGFAGNLTNEEFKRLSTSTKVESIEPDRVATPSARTTQRDAPWGLNRISRRQKSNHRYPALGDYVYDSSAGEGVCAYVIDGGILTEHPDFGGRAASLVDLSPDHDHEDHAGHGTHVAGILGSKAFGVAKKVQLFSVKVMSSHGTTSAGAILAGINYVQSDSIERRREGMCPKGMVANLSIGTWRSYLVNRAAASLVDSGVFVVASAGNFGADIRYYSPGSEPKVCTVGATDREDRMWIKSNYGQDVNILAPGVDVYSTFIRRRARFMTGTSMAAPHVAGLGAYILGKGYRRPVSELCKKLQ